MTPTVAEPATPGGAELVDFEDQFVRLSQVAYRVAFRLLGDRQAAEDAAQDAMERALVRWPRVARHPAPEAWVALVSSQRALKHRHRRNQRRSEDVPLVGADDDERVHRRLEVRSLLGQLPRRQREVLVLRYLADLPEAVVAMELGCSVGTVKQHAARGLARLRSTTANQIEGETSP